ncbi:MAG: winged helix-turn-helix domain-containing protein [Pyrobaculum sp.]
MIEVILGAPLRIRIIMTLWKYGEINATELAHILGTNYRGLIRHVQELSKFGIVEEKRVGRIRLVRLRNIGPIDELIRALIEAERYLNSKEESLHQLG